MNAIVAVGNNVRRFRLERHLSLGELARVAGLAKQTLANLESGNGNPTIETLFAVARALGVGVTWLLTEWGSPVHVQRAADGEWQIEAGRRVRTLDRTFGSGQVNTVIIELPSGAKENLPVLPSGALHHTYVIAGSVVAGPVGQETTLREGDFIRFPADVEHVLRAGSKKATVHVVTTVPQAQQFAG